MALPSEKKNAQNMDLASYFHPELNFEPFTPSPPRLYKHLRRRMDIWIGDEENIPAFASCPAWNISFTVPV